MDHVCFWGDPSAMPRRLAVLLLIAIGTAACRGAGDARRPQIVQPGAPGEPARVIDAASATDLSRVGHTAGDVQFMQAMIGHHSQAIEMVALLPSRTAREDMKLLAQRIEASQADEIELMRRWLEHRGAQVPAAHAHHGSGPALMPGMLTRDEMGRLAAAHGAEFDRLFLELMIKHHQGALVMVRDLFATAGAGQEADIFAFASDVDADQRIEIARMGYMLQELQR
jgi:uncharacterized protein (DUF305 family)